MVSDALTLLMGFQIRLSFDMASLAYCYHIALTEVSRSLRLRRLYAPGYINVGASLLAFLEAFWDIFNYGPHPHQV